MLLAHPAIIDPILPPNLINYPPPDYPLHQRDNYLAPTNTDPGTIPTYIPQHIPAVKTSWYDRQEDKISFFYGRLYFGGNPSYSNSFEIVKKIRPISVPYSPEGSTQHSFMKVSMKHSFMKVL